MRGEERSGMDPSDEAVPDLDQRFDEDYLYFYAAAQTPERNEREAALLARLLELAPGMEVLDVPCGFGRIANRLAARGCRVTGLDASPLFLARARQDAAALDVPVDYVAGDMRALPWAARFDRLVCWFTSFGYFDDATDRQVLAGFRRALRPGGRLVLDHANLPRLVRAQPSAAAPSMSVLADLGEECVLFRTRYDPPSGRIEYERWVVRSGRLSRYPFSVRGFTFAELRDWLVQAGFARVEAYGSDGGPLTLDSPGMVAVAHLE
jgi:SAM-dependent methyltransferase